MSSKLMHHVQLSVLSVLTIRFTKSRFDSSFCSNEKFYVHTLFGVLLYLQQVRLTPIHELRVYRVQESFLDTKDLLFSLYLF